MWSPATLTEMLAARAERDPECPAVTFDKRDWSFAELWRGAGSVANQLAELQVAPGDRVVLNIANGPEFFFAFYGVLRVGAIAVPVFPNSGAPRIADRLARCGARVLLCSSQLDAEARAVLGSACAEAGATVVSCPAEPGHLPAPYHRGNGEEVVMLQYTSGSTGQPKGVQLTHRGLLGNVQQMIHGMQISSEDVFVSWLPVHHDMGLVLMTITPFFVGARLVLLPTSLRITRTWLRSIAEYKGSFTAAPDFAYRLCLRTIRDPQCYDLSSLRVALNAAEPVRATTIRDFEATFGLGRVMTAGYGLAEATVGVSMSPPGAACREDDRGHVSLGPPFPEVEIQIADGDGAALAADEIGRILIRSPANTPGYFEDPVATAALIREDGFLDSGDVGYLDGDGNLVFTSRLKNIIISGGRNLAPQELEKAAETVDGVRSAAAVGIDAGGVEGEQPVLIAEVRPGLGEEEYEDLTIRIVQRLHERLGLRPARVVLVVPSTIPRTNNGKLQHSLLRQRLVDGEPEFNARILFPQDTP
jgi:acyl-CoA synthetase (AMP-forming)/AMP-acid ligase II